MKLFNVRFISGILFLLCAISSASADVKMRVRTASGGITFESTYYIKGQRTRSTTDTNTMQGKSSFTNIVQCDLKRVLNIIEQKRMYMATSLPETALSPTTNHGQNSTAQPEQKAKHRVMTYITTITDLGEKKEILGFPTRHLKISYKVELPDDCNPYKDGAMSRVDTDGWFADLGIEYGSSCMTDQIPKQNIPECIDEVRKQTIGNVHIGYPLFNTTTYYFQSGSTTATFEVLEISLAKLDDSLFEVPAGYRETKDVTELFGQPKQPQNLEAPNVIEAKKSGTIRVGVVLLNNKTNHSVSTESLRDALIIHFVKSEIDAVPLLGRESSEIEADAKRKECDYILYTDIIDLRPLVKDARDAETVNASGGSIAKEGAQVRVDFRLLVANTLSLELTSSITSKEAGPDDIVTSMALEQEAKMIATKIRKKL